MISKKFISLFACMALVLMAGSLIADPGLSSRLPQIPQFHKDMLGDSRIVTELVSMNLQQARTPKRVPTRLIIEQPVVSTLVGLGMGICGAFIGYGIAEKAKFSTSNEEMMGAFIGGFSGLVFGNAFATWHYAKMKGISGSFEGSLVGSLIGGFVGIALAEHFLHLAPLVIGPPIFATISFHLTRD